MEDRKANIFALSSLVFLISVIVVARVVLHLSKSFFLIIGAAVAAIFAVITFYFIRRHLRHRRRVMETRLASEGKELRIEYSFLRKIAGLPTKFRYKELEEVTDNWKSVIGKGASACVFKGVMKDGTAIAVKRIQHEEERGEKEFRSEIAAIASVQHVNLVRLFGYCIHNSSRFLVYEFIPNGSLANWIFSRPATARNNGSRGGCLSWGLRSDVALDVAKALAYLHHDCRSRVLHLDVKPENILLDENHRAIVSDFGLSKLMTRDESRVLTTLRGTKGYLAPEWLLELGVTEKSDVFSYGMVLLELIGGRRNVTVIDGGSELSKRKFQYFPKIVTEKLKAGRVMEVVDPRLLDLGGIDEKEVKKLVHVALWCIQEKVRRRPSMVEVVKWLEGRVAVEEPPETQMIVVDLLSIDDEDGEGEGQGQNGNKRKKPKVIARVASQLNGCLSSSSLSSKSFSYSMSIISPR
ncbi:probable receptor-like protein kinase At5g20050 [Cynara cardunculus var. scolymus]|uniref:probable receptor-like protein kinase At5g20050 n=1 Tax=Cynara cardunculus var. scolymus TaxID=59895 RepID=UPI000D62D9CA|nr:probable receptor-like protein kinase At5g20050 [Cynara cardunculus var. scolymus]